jgi:hypothetical protein
MKRYLKNLYCSAFAILIISSLTTPALAQPNDDEVNTEDKGRVITLVVENDMLGKGTDQNYTSGISLTYLDLEFEIPQLARELDRYIPTFVLNETSSVYYTLGHNIYTPDDITLSQQLDDDRPWAGFLYGSMGLVSVNEDHVDNLEVTLGIVGPLAFGEQFQKFTHKHISDSPKPRGWDNQLKNEPGLMIGWQRRWPEFFTQEFLNLNFALEPNIGVTLGNIYTYANTGWSFRLGPEAEKWQDTPARVRPAIPGTGFFQIPDDSPWSWFFFGGVDGRAMARNIFLDGNTFTDSHSVDKHYLVADANVGFAVTYEQFRASYTLNYRTAEYQAQDDNDIFGALSFAYRF